MRIREWIIDRLGIREVMGYLSKKSVPRHRYSFLYIFGGLTTFFFGIQIISGILLLIYYSPTPETAYQSISFIMNIVPYGWLIRSVHSWSSHLLIASLLIHFASTFFMQAYRKPRELVWMSGVILFFLMLGFGFTGYLLPWDTTAYFATQIGTEIPRSTPVVGELIVKILRGGDSITGETLKRLFALHVAILPLVVVILVVLHIVINQFQGTSIPIGIEPGRNPIRFFPDFLYLDFISWVAGTIILFWLAFLLPVHQGVIADPFSPAPAGIKPEWYFLPLFQTLRMAPTTVFGMNSELVINSAVGLVGIGVIMLPFLDQKSARDQRGMMVVLLGMAGFAYCIVSTFLAYFT